jgi:hypothetical protein
MSLLSELRARGVWKVVVEFAGSGDEGSVQGIALTRRTLIPGESEPREVIEELAWSDDSALWQLLGEYVYDESDYDWINNDGGHGELRIDVETGEATFDRYAYETVSNELPQLKKEVT